MEVAYCAFDCGNAYAVENLGFGSLFTQTHPTARVTHTAMVLLSQVEVAYCAFDCGNAYAVENLDFGSFLGGSAADDAPPAREWHQVT